MTSEPNLPVASHAHHDSRLPWLYIGVALLIGAFVSCPCGIGAGWLLGRTQAKNNATMGDLIQHLKKAGVHGEYRQTFAVLAGAKESGVYTGDGFSAELFLFDNIETAKSMEKTGANGVQCHRNGRFVLLEGRGKEKILPAFSSFR
jgi:hypothetical protein